MSSRTSIAFIIRRIAYSMQRMVSPRSTAAMQRPRRPMSRSAFDNYIFFFRGVASNNH